MGDVGNFLFGGSQQQSQGSNQGNSSSSSQQQSTQSSNQNSQSQSQQNASSSSSSAQGNHGYNAIAAAMNPTLNYTSAGGNMLGALLGIPGYTSTGYVNPNPTPTPPTATGGGTSGTGGGTTGHVGSGHGGIVDRHRDLLNRLGSSILQMHSMGQAPASAPPPGPNTQFPVNPVPPAPSPAGIAVPASNVPSHLLNRMPARARGGPVNAGQPTIVGEHRPEVFVPNTNGTIIPSTEGTQNPRHSGMQPGFGGMLGNSGHTGMGSTPPIMAPGQVPVAPTGQLPTASQVPPAPTTPAVDPQQQALNNYYNSAGGQFLLNQGVNQIYGNNSASGFAQSGATLKALENYRTGLASQYLQNYIGNVEDFSKLGLGGASSIASAGGYGNSSGQSKSSGSSSSSSVGSSQGQSTGSSVGSSQSSGQTGSNGDSKKGVL